MKVFNEVGKLVWDREKEESKTDWSKVELGTDVEFSVGNDTWKRQNLYYSNLKVELY